MPLGKTFTAYEIVFFYRDLGYLKAEHEALFLLHVNSQHIYQVLLHSYINQSLANKQGKILHMALQEDNLKVDEGAKTCVSFSLVWHL